MKRKLYYCPACKAATNAHHDLSPVYGKCPICGELHSYFLSGIDGLSWCSFDDETEIEIVQRTLGIEVHLAKAGDGVIWFVPSEEEEMGL